MITLESNLFIILLLNDEFLFASEIKSLLQHPRCPREVDVEALAELFTFRYVPSPKTIFKGIFKLPPGHLMKVKRNHIQIDRYWEWIPQINNECTRK